MGVFKGVRVHYLFIFYYYYSFVCLFIYCSIYIYVNINHYQYLSVSANISINQYQHAQTNININQYQPISISILSMLCFFLFQYSSLHSPQPASLKSGQKVSRHEVFAQRVVGVHTQLPRQEPANHLHLLRGGHEETMGRAPAVRRHESHS